MVVFVYSYVYCQAMLVSHDAFGCLLSLFDIIDITCMIVTK